VHSGRVTPSISVWKSQGSTGGLVDAQELYGRHAAKTTIDILSEQQGTAADPVVIWAGDADPAAMVGGRCCGLISAELHRLPGSG
jgi:hypothetical protein